MDITLGDCSPVKLFSMYGKYNNYKEVYNVYTLHILNFKFSSNFHLLLDLISCWKELQAQDFLISFRELLIIMGDIFFLCFCYTFNLLQIFLLTLKKSS